MFDFFGPSEKQISFFFKKEKMNPKLQIFRGAEVDWQKKFVR